MRGVPRERAGRCLKKGEYLYIYILWVPSYILYHAIPIYGSLCKLYYYIMYYIAYHVYIGNDIIIPRSPAVAVNVTFKRSNSGEIIEQNRGVLKPWCIGSSLRARINCH